jgi:hypothetical protein
MNNVGFSDISFPVFRLGKEAPIIEEGVSFYLLGRDTKYSDAEYIMKIIDDKNRPEESFALRRLAMKNEGVNLHSLNKAIFFLSDLVKLAKGNTWFIDKNGQLFEYTKTQRVKLIFKKITKVTAIMTGGAIIEVQGIPSRFKTLYAPTHEMTHAGLLVVGNTHILYGLYDQEYAATTRVI